MPTHQLKARRLRVICAILVMFCSRLHAPAENIADAILKLDAQVKPVNPAMFQTLHTVLEDASARIGALHRRDTNWDSVYARAALKCIDDALINHGFVYPDVGFVDQLADGLTPFQMTAAREHSFAAQFHNLRRLTMITNRFPGPFYAVDCDIASFIYLGVADRLRLPIHLLDIPGKFGDDGHDLVRWREGAHYLDWETMDGNVRSDASYIGEFALTAAEIKAGSALSDLTADQVMGYEHFLIALRYERQGEYEVALRELSTSLKLYPEGLVAHNNYAWDTAVGLDLKKRDNPRAIWEAQYVLKLVDDYDVRDTLAAAYASAGSFDRAIHEEQTVLQSAPNHHDYQQRLKLFEQHRPYRETNSVATDVFQP